jgi:hypothetical protein
MKNNNHTWPTIEKKGPDLIALVGWMIVLSIAFYFIYTNALRYFDFSNTVVYTSGPTGSKPFKAFLVTHVAGGVLALLIGPLQFSTLIRKKYAPLHKIIGKVYLICILVSGLAATYLAIVHNLLIKHEFTFAIGALAMGFAWFVTAGMALWAIKKRNFLQHQEWMIRSYVLTSNFILFRLMFYGLFSIENFPYRNELAGITVWASWAVPLFITEVVLQAKKIHLSNRSSKKPQIHQVV